MLRKRPNYRNIHNTVVNVTVYEDFDGYNAYEAILESSHYKLKQFGN